MSEGRNAETTKHQESWVIEQLDIQLLVKEDVNVVGHAADLDGVPAFVADDAAEVFVNAQADGFVEEGTAMFGTEDEMELQVVMGAGHGCEDSPPPLRGGIVLLPFSPRVSLGASPVATCGSPLRGSGPPGSGGEVRESNEQCSGSCGQLSTLGLRLSTRPDGFPFE